MHATLAGVANVQIRDFPDDLHHKLRGRAEAEGMSLNSYLTRELTNLAEVMTIREWLAEVASEEPLDLEFDPAELIREGRREAGRE